MNIRFVFQLIFVFRKHKIEELDQLRWICIFNKIGFNVFYVNVKGFPIITNFKRPIYLTFN